jgi:hypothetical protein
MRIVGIFALTVGAAMLVGVLPLFIYESRQTRDAEAEIARFESDIEAWQDSLAYTATGADSVAIQERIFGRQEGISRTNYHLARNRTALQGWWKPAGPGGTLLIAGAFLMVLGWYTLKRAVNAPWNLPPLDERYRDHG